jgi:hypothetical protein
MTEPRALAEARRHLSQAESGFRTEDGRVHLEEGLACLEEALLEGDARHRTIAANLLSSYSTRICEAVKRLVDTDRALPEPDLEHLFKVLLAFDAGELELPEYVRALKIDVVRGLIERYYEGHSAEDKARALQQLAGLARRETSE